MPSRIAATKGKGWTYKVLALGSFLIYGGLVAIFFRASIGHCLCAFFVAKSTVQRFILVYTLVLLTMESVTRTPKSESSYTPSTSLHNVVSIP